MGVALPRRTFVSSAERFAGSSCRTFPTLHVGLKERHHLFRPDLFTVSGSRVVKADVVAVDHAATSDLTLDSEKAVLAKINACRSSTALLQIVHSYPCLMDPVNACTAYSALAKVWASAPIHMPWTAPALVQVCDKRSTPRHVGLDSRNWLSLLALVCSMRRGSAALHG